MSKPIKHTIEVIIAEDGKIETTITGIKGPQCDQVGKWLDRVGRTYEHKKTRDYMREPETKKRIRQPLRGGGGE